MWEIKSNLFLFHHTKINLDLSRDCNYAKHVWYALNDQTLPRFSSGTLYDWCHTKYQHHLWFLLTGFILLGCLHEQKKFIIGDSVKL